MANFQASGVNETDAGTTAKTALQVAAQWKQTRGRPLNKSVVAHEGWECLFPILTDLMNVVGFEVSIVALMEANQDGHDFAQRERWRSLSERESLSLTRF